MGVLGWLGPTGDWNFNEIMDPKEPVGLQNSDDNLAIPDSYMFVNVYYRLQYPHEGRWKAFVQPTFNYAVYTVENPNAPFQVRPYGFGLNLGCTYSF